MASQLHSSFGSPGDASTQTLNAISQAARAGGPMEIKLPGWKQPLTYYEIQYDSDDDFMEDAADCEAGTHQIHDEARNWRQLRLTEMEVAMICIMNQLTDKLHWEEKIKDDEVRKRWSSEAIAALQTVISPHIGEQQDSEAVPSASNVNSSTGAVSYDESELLGKAADFLIKELNDAAEQSKQHRCVPVLGIGAADIVKSDAIIPENFRQRLVSLIRELEDDPRRPIDWHPGQENVVRNLVHPSLYPLQYGRTQIMPFETIPLETAVTYTGQGEVLPQQDDSVKRHGFSHQFQWLPADVQLHSDKPGGVRFHSYINNLEWPRYKRLYEALGELVRYSIPLWNRCLARSMGSIPRRIPCDDEAQTWNPPKDPIPEPPDVFEDDDGEIFNLKEQIEWYEQLKINPKFALQEQKERWGRLHRKPAWPEPIPYSDFRSKVDGKLPIDLLKEYQKNGLQVIVKIANVHLTPERPKYEAGSWHVEGLANEHICATAIYYYDGENITESELSFRGGAVLSAATTSYPQHDFKGLERVYGTDLIEGIQIQDLATVKTPMRRLLAFPNVFQHCVMPFELADKTRPGHRKLVVLWLVNPDRKIISTANVPPQQKAQCVQYLREFSSAKRLPAEIGEIIANSTTSHLPTDEEARELRLRLIEERSVPGSAYATITRTYNFCEH